MKNCIFCQIVSGKIPSYKVYEDKDYLAFLSIRPLNSGHVLVIPKKHFRWVWDLPTDRKTTSNIGQYYELISKIANAIKKVYEIEYVVSLIFGEEVSHAHVWLVPRFENDGHEDAIDLKNVKEIGEEEMKQVAEKIKKNLNHG